MTMTNTVFKLEHLHPPVEGLPRISQNKHGYSELLYAHLLDGEGQRLTYTHFTAKVGFMLYLKGYILYLAG